MQSPKGLPQPRIADNTLVKEPARAFRSKLVLEPGEFASIAEPKFREGIAPSYVSRALSPWRKAAA